MSNPSEEFDTYFVLAEEEGIRIDKLLSNKFPQYSRSYFQKLIQNGSVLINGEQVKKRICPEEGDELEICFQATEELSLKPEEIPLDILYEDEYLIAINKPPGMVVHPAPGHWSGTFANALVYHLKGKSFGSDPLRPGIVHRLDKETSGVLIAAKTAAAHEKLVDLFASRRIEKTYLAICLGRPKSGVIKAPIGRHPVHRKEMAILPDGREAITTIQLAAFNDHLSLVIAKPETGRTHQIRVHLKHLGAPVLGDPVYGSDRLNKALSPPRLLLHAYRLFFLHPMTKAPIKLAAPIPEDMLAAIRKLAIDPISLPEKVL